MRFLRPILLLLVMFAACPQSEAQNIRQISSRNGLSNSAVICLFQDSERYLWVGTYDGLNKYNGVDIRIYNPDIKDQHSLSGNVIRKVVESKHDFLWIMTKGGLNQFSRRKDRVEAYFTEFQEDCSIACDSRGNLYILTRAGSFFYYDFELQNFNEIPVPGLRLGRGWVNLIIDTEDRVWITNNGQIRQYAINRPDGGAPELEPLGNFKHPGYVGYIYYDNGKKIIIDGNSDLYIIAADEKIFIRNVSPIMEEYGGDISSIIFDDDNLVIGFRTTGVVRLVRSKGYEAEKIPINCGVFSLLKDDVQDILWIGTDGQGVYACADEEYTFKGINLEELPLKTQRPVRAILSDYRHDLWLGTKGNGIIRIRDYENASEYTTQNVHHLSVDDGLSNSSVFAFEMSRKNNVIWIGSSGPRLNYYSYEDRKIHTLKCDNPVEFAEVHSIYEESPDVLWVSSMFSLLRLDIHKTGNAIEARNIRRYEFDVKNKELFNKIYAICPENDSIMWLAMRGNGAIRLNNRSGGYNIVTFDDDGIAPMNDVLSVHMDRDKNLWFGSSYGINKLTRQADGTFRSRNYNESDGLPNNTIHGILESAGGDLWFSSNTGLILFDRAKNTFRNFNQKTGLKVIEFSDNAYYKEERTSKCFFGGIDGVVWIEPGEKKSYIFVPPIFFTKLHILNEEVNIDDFYVTGKGRNTLRLKHDQNFFTVAFSVNDFIEGASKKFSYTLENFSEVWMNTNSREAQFTNIPPGKYTLRVKYGSDFGQESQTASLDIEILPPWYFSIYAKLFYFLAAIGLIFLAFLYVTKRYERKRLKMARQLSEKYKEEMYENKLRFFTNITHEFCTPLTLIHTPSERILNYEGSDQYIRKYAHIIKSNSERLNTLIQEIIDFRRMETGNKVCKIERCDINAVCNEIMEAFADLAEENNIDFSLGINPVVIWNSDRSCITTILNNLISNAFKYTIPGGNINITVGVENEELVLKVYNSGKGIREDDIPYMFNRYSVLDNVGQNSIKGISSRNGLGLAICKSMAELLGGTIGIESEVGKYARFIVKLPPRELPKQENISAVPGDMVPELPVASQSKYQDVPRMDKETVGEIIPHDPDGRPKILIVDDNEEILLVLKEILSEDYAVYTATDGNEGLEQMANHMPDLVITDIMMPNQDGISMTKQIKLDPHTTHIPIIIISAKSAIDDRIEGIESGADAYITKPFDIQYLKTLVKQLMEKHRKLREYYNSSASAFEYMDGRLLSKEDRDFIQSAVHSIDQNIGHIEFSPEDLADNLRISLRSLYRKFKDLGLPSPKDFIKKQRIEYSAKLLLSTNLTIQEIMYNTGFTTRSHFYKEFTKRYKLSPKEYREQETSGIDE